MKTVLLSLFVVLGCQSVLAGELPVAPNPEAVPLSREAMKIASILVDARISKEAQLFSQGTDFLEEATHTAMNDLDIYVFKGMRLLGGDIPCAWTTLTVTESAPEPNFFGFGFIRPLKAVFEVEESENCKSK